MLTKERQGCQGDASKWKETKAVIRFCLTRKNIMESALWPSFVFMIWKRGSHECGARERNLTELVCEVEAKILGYRARAVTRGPGHLSQPGAQAGRE